MLPPLQDIFWKSLAMMHRTRMALGVDELEGRSLLSGISYTLTTDQSTYQVGQPIQITFTETNTGDRPVTVSLNPTDFPCPSTAVRSGSRTRGRKQDRDEFSEDSLPCVQQAAP